MQELSEAGLPLYTLPNVVLTHHIAGLMNKLSKEVKYYDFP